MHVKNEEKVIQNCLESVKWADEIFVVDSFSTDRTKDIARQYTDKIIDHEYINSAQQKNWAIKNLPFRNDWIFIIDADERVTTELQEEIQNVLNNQKNRDVDINGYYIPRINYFLGRRIRHCGWHPDHQLRLFKKEKGIYDGREVHSQILLEGQAGYLKNPIIHLARDSIFEYISKLNRHTSWEVSEMSKKQTHLLVETNIPRPLYKKILRKIWKYLPFKPIITFIWLYIFRLGFLDGYRGFLISIFQSFYVFISYAKLWERRQKSVEK